MSQLTYRLATFADFEDFYRIKCDKENIAWGGHTQAPEENSFYKWYQCQLVSDCRRIYLVYDQNEPCAYFYIDKINDSTYELSSGVLSEYTNKGIGLFTVKESIKIIQSLGGKVCIAWIAENNIASYKRFLKEDFTCTNEYEIRNLPLLKGVHYFYKWIKEL